MSRMTIPRGNALAVLASFVQATSSSKMLTVVCASTASWRRVVQASVRNDNAMRPRGIAINDSRTGRLSDFRRASAAHCGDAAPFVILDDEGAAAGRLTLGGIVRGPFQSCAMGYGVAENRAGRGLATGAVSAAVEHACGELGLHQVLAETFVANARSLRRNSFSRFWLAPKYLNIAGRWQDHIMNQRLANDLEHPPGS